LKLDASRVGDDALRSGIAARLHLTDGTTREVTLDAVRRHKGRLLVRIAGIDAPSAAAAFIDARVAIARDDAPLSDGEYFDDELRGCRLLDEAGVERGAVVDVLHYPNGDFLVVGDARALVPLVRAFIASIDVERKMIRVSLPAGLLDASEAEEA
jgi:16S rRNA processing protein RimM